MKKSMSMTQHVRTGRRVYIDFIKILAIILVVFNHTGKQGFLLFIQNRESVLYPAYLFNAALVKIAVPLLFMCSGALLLGKQESYKTVLTKRFLRFFVILILALIVMYFYSRIKAGKSLSAAQFLEKTWKGNIAGPYWYLYRFLAYILMLPLLRKIVNGMKKSDFLWVLILFTIMRAVPVIEFLIWKGKVTHCDDFFLFIELDYVVFPLLGYYIDKNDLPGKTGKTMLLLVVLSLAEIVVFCTITHYRCTLLNKWDNTNSQMFLSRMIVFPTITVFYACKRWLTCHHPGPRAENTIITLSGLVFGTYLLEGIGRSETRGIYEFLKPYIHSLPASWVWVLCTCVVCGLATYIMKKIPGVKKYL